MSATREWKTCRVYDPAVDVSHKKDPDTGENVVRHGPEGQEIDVLVSDTERFLESRDPEDLAFKTGEEPAWFWLRPLSNRQLREYVERASTAGEKYARAFECSVMRIENWRASPDDPASTVLLNHREDGLRLLKPEEHDRLADLGVKLADQWDIGSAAYVRAVVPLGCGGQLLVPRSSVTALAAKRVACQSAETSDLDSQSKSAPKEAPEAQEPPQ